MSRSHVRLAHAVAGGVALLTILTFWISTAVVEVAGSPEAIVNLKRALPWGLLVLVPALAGTGASGNALVRQRAGRLVRRKTARMRAAAVIGAVVLVPCMLYLAFTASPDDLGVTFYTVQAVELAAGATNITLLALNMRDGFRLTGRLRPGRPPRSPAKRVASTQGPR